MAEVNPFRRQTFLGFGVVFLAVVFAVVPNAVLADEMVPDNPSAQQAKEDKTDYEFGGQILTLTEPKKDVRSHLR